MPIAITTEAVSDAHDVKCIREHVRMRTLLIRVLIATDNGIDEAAINVIRKDINTLLYPLPEYHYPNGLMF